MKASDKSAALTSELPGMPRAVRRGRPPKADAMTDAERSRKFRKARKTMKIGDKMAATISRFAREFDLTEDEVVQHLLRFALCNRNWTQTGFPSRHGNSDQ
jgi:hypothetical protein